VGIGAWGLAIGDSAQSPSPNPQSPIPKPQSPNKDFRIINKNLKKNTKTKNLKSK